MPDPRILFPILVAYLVAASCAVSAPALALIIALAVALALPSSRRLSALRTLGFLAPGLSGMAAIVLVLEGPGPALISLLRLLALALGTSVFFLYCGRRELERLLLDLGLPILFAFSVSTAIAFIPLLREEVLAVYDAERSRGVPVDNPLRMPFLLGTFLTPILPACFRLADELGESLIARGLAKRPRDF